MATELQMPAMEIPLLRDGDRMDRAEFERRWDAMPDLKKAELIEGVVYIMSSLSMDHGTPHFDLIGLMAWYRLLTKGVQGADNASIRFDDLNMPQPDVVLRIDDQHGGQSTISEDRYLEGGPELIAEIANTTAARDLGVKKNVYRRHGVKEYIVWRVEDRAIDWFTLQGNKYVPLQPGPDGIFRSVVFPGLWIDAAALISGDSAALLRAAQLGHGSPEHGVFIGELQRRAGSAV
ncbi:MAG TPA: Uma2 family endonuclease [Urbifossiella sp.]|jgi:Uma2 family endonuclease